MMQVENLDIIVRGVDGVEKNGTLNRSVTGEYKLTIEGEEKDFVIVTQEATDIISLVLSSTANLVAETVGRLNATAHANLTLRTPDEKEIPLAVIKGDYFIEPGCIIIAFNDAIIRTAAVGTVVANTYYNHEIIGSIVRVAVHNTEEEK